MRFCHFGCFVAATRTQCWQLTRCHGGKKIERAEFRQDASALNLARVATTVHVSVSNALHVPTRSQRQTALASVESFRSQQARSTRIAQKCCSKWHVWYECLQTTAHYWHLPASNQAVPSLRYGHLVQPRPFGACFLILADMTKPRCSQAVLIHYKASHLRATAPTVTSALSSLFFLAEAPRCHGASQNRSHGHTNLNPDGPFYLTLFPTSSVHTLLAVMNPSSPRHQ